ncbi:PLP-dependent aminotransferase family protein, partial [Trinickia caryophylli]
FHVLPGDAGLHVYAEWLRSGEEFAALQAAAGKRGVEFRDAAIYRAGPGVPSACFVFSHLDAAGIAKGIERLVLAWNDVQKST